jgi:hypothetical protein
LEFFNEEAKEKRFCVNSRNAMPKRVIERNVGKFYFVYTLARDIDRGCSCEQNRKIVRDGGNISWKNLRFLHAAYCPYQKHYTRSFFSSTLMMFAQHVCVVNYEKRYTRGHCFMWVYQAS